MLVDAKNCNKNKIFNYFSSSQQKSLRNWKQNFDVAIKSDVVSLILLVLCIVLLKILLFELICWSVNYYVIYYDFIISLTVLIIIAELIDHDFTNMSTVGKWFLIEQRKTRNSLRSYLLFYLNLREKFMNEELDGTISISVCHFNKKKM